MISGLIGGLPITRLFRSSAIFSQEEKQISAISPWCFFLISVMTIPGLLNMILLSVLAAILLIVGYKLPNQNCLFDFKLGWRQFYLL